MPPPPWKNSRLSQIISDHTASPTHGGSGSFLVDTGFPTSLVDLFVMNSHRMEKTEAELASESESESVSSATTPRSPLDSLRSSRRPVSESIPMNKSESKGYFWLWWIFKVFFVVVLAMALAMSTKQLAVGITVSAFSLLLMELFGNYIVKPWLYSRKSLKNDNHSRSIESEVQIKENDCNADSNVVETPNPKPDTHSRLPIVEIRAMKSILSSPRFHKRSVSVDMGTTKDLHAFKSFNLNWFSEEGKDVVKKEDTDTDNHSELDQILKPLDHVPNQIVHKSNSRKIKSKIKKFVKKLKSSKKEYTDRRNGASYAGPSGGSESVFPSIKMNENNHELLIDDANSRLTEDSQVTEMEDKLLSIGKDGRCGVEGRRGLRRRKSTYCVAMLAVVLAGLVGGRFCGIAFTVIWCSVMKMIGKEEEGLSGSG